MRKSYIFIVSSPLGVNRFGSEHTKKRAENHVYKYYLEHNNTRVQVCKEFFCGTLSISQQRIYYFHEKIQNPTTSVPRSPFKGRNVKKTYIK